MELVLVQESTVDSMDFCDNSTAEHSVVAFVSGKASITLSCKRFTIVEKLEYIPYISIKLDDVCR